MSPKHYVRQWYGTALVLSLFAGMTLAAAVEAAGKKPKEAGERRTPDQMQPMLLNAGTNPTLRYPAMSESGWTVKSFSYGWFDISRNNVRYTVVQPSKKAEEGFDIPRGEIGEIGLELNVWTILNFRPLQAKRNGGRKLYWFVYVPQDRWGTVHTSVGMGKLQNAGAAGTASMRSALSNPDGVLNALVEVPVRYGDLAKVKALLADNPDLPSYRDKAGETPLHLAAAVGQEDMAKLLLEEGANVSAKDNAGETPLHEAVKEGRQTLAELLLGKGADAGAKDNAGDTPLSLARDHLDVAKLLCQHLAACGQIFEAADQGELELAKGLLKADPKLVYGRDDRGRTPLHHAASADHKDVAEQLLANPAEVNATDRDGATPLHLAAAGGHEDVAQLLITHGGDALVRSGDGSTPSLLAAKDGRTELAEFLRRQEPSAAAQAINAAAALLGSTNTTMLGNRVPRGVRALSTDARATTNITSNGQVFGAGVQFVPPDAQGFLVSEQHPARLQLVPPVLPMADNLPVVHAFVQAHSGEQLKTDIVGDLKGNWEVSGNGSLLFAGGAESGGKWYLNEGELQFRGGVAVGGHLIVFTKGEIVSTSQWGSSCTEGTVAKLDGVDYELMGQVWKPKN